MMHAPPTTRAPLLWALIPIMLGIILSHWLSKTWMIPLLGVGLSTCILGLMIHTKKRHPWLARSLCISGGILLSSAYTLNQTPSLARDETLPPREAYLSLEITRLFSREDPYHRQGGIALIRQAPQHLPELQGQRVVFFLKKRSHSPQRGEIWAAHGVLDTFPQKTAPFSFAATQKNEGIYFSLNRGAFIEREQKAGLMTLWLTQSDLYFQDILARGIPYKAQGIYTAMLLGNKQKLDPQTKTQFIRSGTLHLFAISGLHIGVIAFVLFALLHWLPLHKVANTCIGLSLLLLYVLIIGATPSAMRAFLMIALLWGAYAFKRRPAPFSALVASALCVLLINPLQLWSPGFQLSYSVVTGILLYGLPLAEFLKDRWGVSYDPFIPVDEIPFWKRTAVRAQCRLLESSAITLSATLLSTPLVLAYFKVFSPGAFLLNLILIPLASFTIILGFTSLIFGIFAIPFIPTLLNQLAALCITGLTKSVAWGLNIPYIFWEAKGRSTLLILIGLLGLLALLLCTRPCLRQNHFARLLGPLLFAVLWALIALNPDSMVML